MTAGDASHWFGVGIGLLDKGRADNAEHAFRKALALDPRHAKANANVGLILQRAGKNAEAESYYRAAVDSDPGLAQAWFNLGTLQLGRRLMGDAVDCFRRAVALDGNQAQWHSALVSTLMEVGEAEAALAALRDSRGLAAETHLCPSDMQHALNISSGEAPQKIFDEHIAWAMRLGADGRGAMHDNAPELGRKLRLGYLAPDFNDPTLACLIEPVLEHRNRGDFEVLCYSDADIESVDAWRMRDLADLWYPTARVSNDQLAGRIRDDRIDILVDLAGHSARGRRIALLAQKPAPIQISWLDYPCAAGLDLMDYRITDDRLTPPGEQRQGTERLLRMGESRWCFKPWPDAPAPGPLPSAATGMLTFGSFRDLSLLTHHTFTLWASVLHALPQARLLIAARGALEQKARIGDLFRQEGVDPSRITLHDRDPAAASLSRYAGVDVILDVTPCAGIATTFESLWMGVPVVTLAGGTEASRSGASILAALDMQALVARSEGEYVRIAVSLAADPQRLAELRRELRPRLARSPLTDGRLFATRLEARYREAWRAWCDGKSARPVAAQPGVSVARATPPRVVVDGVFFQDYGTGIARVWRTLFREWIKSGFAENVLLLDREGTAPGMPGLRVRKVPRHSYDRLDEDRAMLQAVCDEEHATVFASTYYTTPVRTPVVMMVHDMIAEILNADPAEPAWREKTHCISRAARFVAVSRSTARDLRRIHPELSSRSVTVAHNGVDPLFRPAAAAEVDEFRRRHGLSRPYFLLVGSKPSYKNARGFFRAFARLPDRSRYNVLCVGSMAELEPAESAVCAGSLVSVPPLGDDDLRLAYCGALALVYPSVYEGFGMPVIEALASGCPVITTAHSSLPEVAGDAAIYVHPFDDRSLAAAMVRIQEAEIRAALRARGLDRAKLFSWTEMARSVAAVLSDVS